MFARTDCRACHLQAQCTTGKRPARTITVTAAAPSGAPQPVAAAPALDWLNKGVFISVGGRRPGGVIYETYLVE